MTQQDDITQRVLTDDEIRNIITGTHQAFGEFKSGYMLVLGRAIESALLSKLRAPVADERAAFKKCHSAIIKAIASIARANGPDTRKEDDPELLYRSPVMDDVVRIRAALDECSAALANAPVADAIQWPTMPESKGQSPILFEDGYAEGWAKCMDECRRAVSQASAPVAGEAHRPLGHVAVLHSPCGTRYLSRITSQHQAQVCAAQWAKEYANVKPGPWPTEAVAVYAAPQASAEYERGHADGWAAGWDQAIKQPQADKDGAEQALKDLVTHGVSVQRIAPADFLAGGQQRAGDVDERAAFEAWAYRAGMGPKFRESMFAAWEARAALSAPQAEQGERKDG